MDRATIQATLAQYGLTVDEEQAKRLLWVASRISGQRVLDYGFGNGLLQVLLGEKDCRLTTVLARGIHRLSPPLEEFILAKNPYSPVSFHTGPLFKLPSADQSIDTLVGGSLLAESSALSLLPELKRVLQPNGKLILCLPIGDQKGMALSRLFPLYALLSYVQGEFITRDIRLEGGYFHYVGRLRKGDERGEDEKFAAFLDGQGSSLFPGLGLKKAYEQLQGEYARLQAEHDALTRHVEALSRRLEQLEQSPLIRLGLKLAGWQNQQAAQSATNDIISEVPSDVSTRETSPAEMASTQAERINSSGKLAKLNPTDSVIEKAGLSPEDTYRGNPSEEGEPFCSLESFLERVKVKGGPLWVMVVPGGRWQGDPFQRAAQLALRLLEKEVPVLYLYENGEEAPPVYAGNYFWQGFHSTLPQVAAKVGPLLNQVKPVLYVAFPHLESARLINRLHLAGWFSVYDPDPLTKEGDPIHEYLLHQACRVMVRSLVQQKRLGAKLSARPVHIPHRTVALETEGEALSRIGASPTRPLPGGERIIVGYMGPVDEAWFDLDLFNRLAAEQERWRFELVGVYRKPYPFPNVTSFGMRQGLRRIRHWSCAILPLREEAIQRGFWPPQLNLYLQLGLPVVTSPLEGTDALPSVWQAAGIADWLKGIKEAASCPSHGVEESLRRLLEEKDPLDQLLADVEDFYRRGGSGTVWAWFREGENLG